MNKRTLGHVAKCAALVAALSATWAAHAANSVPDEKIAVAKSALQRAEQAGAPQLAPVELATARDELARAEKALTARDANAATAMAERADIDAQVAEASAVQQHSRSAANEFDASMQALRAESLRSSQATQ